MVGRVGTSADTTAPSNPWLEGSFAPVGEERTLTDLGARLARSASLRPMEELEATARLYLLLHHHPVRALNDDQVPELRDLFPSGSSAFDDPEGDAGPRPDRRDPVPEDLNWDWWLGVAAERPFIRGSYHPGQWRTRLDFAHCIKDLVDLRLAGVCVHDDEHGSLAMARIACRRAGDVSPE